MLPSSSPPTASAGTVMIEDGAVLGAGAARPVRESDVLAIVRRRGLNVDQVDDSGHTGNALGLVDRSPGE